MPNRCERKGWEYERGTALETPWSAQKEGKRSLQVPEQRHPCSLWWSNKSAINRITPLQVKSVSLIIIICEWPRCLYLHSWAFHYVFSPCPARMGQWEGSLWAPCGQPRWTQGRDKPLQLFCLDKHGMEKVFVKKHLGIGSKQLIAHLGCVRH